MTERDETVIFSLNGDDGLPKQLETFDDFTPAEDRPPSGMANGLVSLGYLMGAIKRTARFWLALGIVGLLIGAAYDVKSPPAEKASASVLITYGPDENPSSAVVDNQAIAESRSVAELAMHKLGLQESVGSFQKATTVTIVTDRVLQITMSAPTSAEAVSRANAVAAAFLQFRASEMEAAQNLLVNSLEQQVAQAKQTVASINSQISQVSAQPSSAQASELKNLRAQLSQATQQLYIDEQTVQDTRASTGTAAAVTGSVMLDPAVALAHSKTKYLVIYGGIGLVIGLVLGLAIVVIRAIVSVRLRRRDDVSQALGAPVKLSVGADGSAAGGRVGMGWPPPAASRSGGSPRTCAAPCRPAPGARPPWPLFRPTTRRSRRWPWCQWRCPVRGTGSTSCWRTWPAARPLPRSWTARPPESGR